MVSTNDVLSLCKNDNLCKFYYNRDLTPIIASVSPKEGVEGDLLTITFEDNHWNPLWMNATTIAVAGKDCPVLDTQDYSLTCAFGRSPAGVHDVIAHVAGIGSSLATIKFKSLLKVTKVSPTAGSLQGGTILVIEGKGFGAAGYDNQIWLGNVPCVPRVMDNTHCAGLKYEGFVECDKESVYGYSSPVVREYAKTFDFSNYERIECVVGGGNHTASKVDLTLTVGDQTKTVSNAFEFSLKRTPIIETIAPNPAGRSVPILLRGYNLEADPVLDKQWYMNIWGFYERFPNVSVFLDKLDVATKTYDRQIFGKNLCFIGDVSTENRMGKHQQWSETNGTQITCTIGDIPEAKYPVHVYIHGKGFAMVKQKVRVGVLVKRIVPSKVSVYGGTSITIYGSGFSRFNSHNRVDLGGKQKCWVTSSTHYKIVCIPGAPGKQQQNKVTVYVTCGNLAFCNSEPQKSKGNVNFLFSTAMTPQMKLVGSRPIYNPYLGPAVAPGSVIKMDVSLASKAQMKIYSTYSEAKLKTLIRVRLGGSWSNAIKLVGFNPDTGVARMEGVLPAIGIGKQGIQVEMPTGRSKTQVVFVFPHVGTPDVMSTGLGGGLLVTLKSDGIGGWIDNGRPPRAAFSVIYDGKKFTTSNCYPMHNVRWDKRQGPLLDMSMNKCRGFCNDYRYFGVHDGETCVCSNKQPTKATLADRCNKLCSSDFNRRGNKCGGNWYITLFEKCCFTDIYLAPEEWSYQQHLPAGARQISSWANLHPPISGTCRLSWYFVYISFLVCFLFGFGFGFGLWFYFTRLLFC